jgi:AcrR family transcriptional regulator
MTVTPKPTDESRLPLSRERVLRAAIELADAGGLGSLSMRRLAQALGVEAMSLYHHVANKDDLLNGIVDIVVGEAELPAPDAAWKPAIRHTAISIHEVLRRHPWATSLVLSADSIARLRYMEAILGTLRRAGFTPEETDHAYHALDSHIMGFGLWVAGMNLGTEADLQAMAAEFMQRMSRERMPYLVEHAGVHLQPRRPDDEGDFVFGLDLILDGLERLLAAH